MSRTKVLIGSRKSRLALAQTEWVQAQLPIPSEIVPMDTTGDLVQDRALHQIGTKGLFTAELETALLDGSIDLAVHSLKDLPTKQPPELPIIILAQRANPADAVVFSERYQHCSSLAELPEGAVVGTSSLRRIAQLSQHFPQLRFFPLRGNVQTRLHKIHTAEHELAAGILAAAGLERLGLSNEISCLLSPEVCLPAAGQGALAVQLSNRDSQRYQELSALLAPLAASDRELACIIAERSALEALEGGCQSIFGASTVTVGDDEIELTACLGQPSGQLVRHSQRANIGNARKIGFEMAAVLKQRLKNFC